MKKCLIVILLVMACLKADEFYVSTSILSAEYIKNISTWDRGLPLSMQLGVAATMNKRGDQASLFLEAAGSGILGVGYSYGFLIADKAPNSKFALLISPEFMLHTINFDWKKSQTSGFMSPFPTSTITIEGKLKGFYASPGISFKIFNNNSEGFNVKFVAAIRYHYKYSEHHDEPVGYSITIKTPYLVSSMEYSAGLIFSYNYKSSNLKQKTPNGVSHE